MLAFAFSYLAFELSQAVPDFLDLFVAYINERCVLTIPYHPEKKAGQSVADQQRALGYVVSAEGVAESMSHIYYFIYLFIYSYPYLYVVQLNHLSFNAQKQL